MNCDIQAREGRSTDIELRRLIKKHPYFTLNTKKVDNNEGNYFQFLMGHAGKIML